MKAISFDRIGSPLEVLQLCDMPTPEVGPGQVLVALRAASINPGDFLFIQSLYPEPKKPALPREIAGQHGAGVIVEAGSGVSLPTGTLVAFSYEKVWAEYVVVPVEWLIPLPPDYPIEKAGQLMNAISAWDLLEQSKATPDTWLALTGGHSTLATMVAQMAKLRGVNVLSIVRRVQPGVDLKALGASAVIDLSKDGTDLTARISEITEGKGLSALVDSIGGTLLEQLVSSLAFRARMILYGGFSPERFSLHTFDLLTRDLQIRSYVYRYFFEPPKKEDSETLNAIVKTMASNEFHVRVGGMHTLDDFEVAIRESWERGERGKRFFVPSGGYAR